MANEEENLVTVNCIRAARLSICLPRGEILGTIREIRDIDCPNGVTVMTDLTVDGLGNGDTCLAAAVDCVMQTDTGNPSPSNVCMLVIRSNLKIKS